MLRSASLPLLFIACFVAEVCVTLPVRAAEPAVINKPNKVWVSRRHKDDPNRNGDVAVALVVKPGALGNKVSAAMYAYDRVDGTTVYQPRAGLPRSLTGEIKGNDIGGASRNRETCHFTNDDGDPLHVYLSLFKGKSAGRGNQRLILRYKAGPAATTGVAVPEPVEESFVMFNALAADPCESEPNEDVLEEEPMPAGGLANLDYLP